jgi:uncharacterized membrane-anchored protein YjiN (DUF445 family)
MAKGIERWAVGSLIFALLLALAGLWLRESGAAPFLGGLVLAFGEAALVGGLADWFAVRALFTHPFGIPFPHSALIPRNRRRITYAIRRLIETEWLPPAALAARVEAFDFVGEGLLPALQVLQPRLREVLRGAVRKALADLDPRETAPFLARSAADGVAPTQLAPLLAGLTQRVRDQGWLEPLLREFVSRLQEWARSSACRTAIFSHLEHAADQYRDSGSWFREFTYNLAEVLGGIDLQSAAGTLQLQLQRFAGAQLEESSPLQQMVRDGLTRFEARLRTEEAFRDQVHHYLLDSAADGTLEEVLAPILESLRRAGLREIGAEDSRLLDWAEQRFEVWLQRLGDDAEARQQLNAWCRQQTIELITRHHSLIGALVEEQMDKLSDAEVTKLIEERVGEDLNWIRLNGTFVGGLVGAVLYLTFALISRQLH